MVKGDTDMYRKNFFGLSMPVKNVKIFAEILLHMRNQITRCFIVDVPYSDVVCFAFFISLHLFAGGVAHTSLTAVE